MPKVNTQVSNGLGKEQAKEKLDYMVQRMERDYGDKIKNLEGVWDEDVLNISFEAMGFKITSMVAVSEDVVNVESQLPMAALPFKGMVQSRITDTLSKMLS
ncbi:MAG: polyhydroxyalkanoic acid system family protein [Pirellulaceae bacterium]